VFSFSFLARSFLLMSLYALPFSTLTLFTSRRIRLRGNLVFLLCLFPATLVIFSVRCFDGGFLRPQSPRNPRSREDFSFPSLVFLQTAPVDAHDRNTCSTAVPLSPGKLRTGPYFYVSFCFLELVCPMFPHLKPVSFSHLPRAVPPFWRLPCFPSVRNHY